MHLSFVLLPEPRSVDGRGVAASHAASFPGAKPLAVAGSPEKVLELSFPGEHAHTMVTAIPAAIATGEVEHAFAFSVAAHSQRERALRSHRAHFIVASEVEPGGLVQSLTRHTRLVAAIAEAHQAVAIYEGNAHATHETDFYLDVAAESEFPLMLWLGVGAGAEPHERFSLLSYGMKQFALPDILLGARRSAAGDAFPMLFDLAGFFIERGAAIPEGETVGRSARERLPVRYVPSPVDPEVRVARIDLP